MTAFLPRRAGRVLLVDDDERVLLFRGWDPARPQVRYWFTPGGGLDPGESPAVAAARELAEETGLRVIPDVLGEPVWRDVTEFTFDGLWYRQAQEFFLHRVPRWQVDTNGFDDIERAAIDEHRWWSLDELTRTHELVFPTDLPQRLRGVLHGEPAC